MRASLESAELARAAYGAGRISAPRVTLAHIVEAWRGRAFSVDELAAAARELDPRIGLATAYRAVAAMREAGFVEQLGTRDGATLYARCATGGHHHHALCTECGAVSDIECPVQVDATGTTGFEVTGHRLVLYGRCAACSSGGGHDR